MKNTYNLVVAKLMLFFIYINLGKAERNTVRYAGKI